MFGRERILDAAYGCLLRQEWRRLPIEPNAFRVDSVILSYQDYADLAGIPVVRLLTEPALTEGCSIAGLCGQDLLLYNENPPVSRQRFTVAHELGHLLLEHHSQGSRQEEEADFFASVLLMPDAVLTALQRRNVRITESFLTGTFGVSAAAARRKQKALVIPPIPHPLDERVEILFYNEIIRLSPLPFLPCNGIDERE